MSPISIFLICGGTFFLGAALLLLAAAIPPPKESRPAALHRMASMAGVILQAISAAPLPILYYWIVAGAVALSIYAQNKPGARLKSHARPAQYTAAVVSILAALYLLPGYRMPRVDWPVGEPLYVIGDSISAGLEDHERTWTAELADATGLEIVNLAAPGATVETALRQAESLPPDARLVLLEIGGNDLLALESATSFETDLTALLEKVAAEGRTIMMLELPLPPFRGGHGRVQRRLARRYDVVLVPKHVLATSFSGTGNTTDGLHLSPSGHQNLARKIRKAFTA